MSILSNKMAFDMLFWHFWKHAWSAFEPPHFAPSLDIFDNCNAV